RTAATLNCNRSMTADELGIAQPPQRAFQMILENVRHRDQIDIVHPGEEIDHGLRTASAAAHQPGLQRLFITGSPNEWQSSCAAEKKTAGKRGVHSRMISNAEL